MKLSHESMGQIKRKSKSIKEKPKKLRNSHDQSIICIENLSNEIFYEIFDYLNGCEINQSFAYLNRRFQQLLESPSLLFKFTFDSEPSGFYMNIYESTLDFNQHQILSIDLSMLNSDMGVITASVINSSFTHLESLTLDTMDPDILLTLLFHLASLPRLFSLIINQQKELQEFNDFYLFVFNLPKLKYLKFSVDGNPISNVTVSLPMSPSQPSSTIEYLVIDHPCNSQDLSNIISYTPYLYRLTVIHTLDIKENFPIITPMTILNLTDLSIHLSSVSFDQLERLISRIDAKLKILRLDIMSDDRAYVNAHRWEQLILHYFSGLEKFYLKYFDFLYNDLQSRTYPKTVNQFFSSFWLERQWILEAETESELTIYSIRPYNEKWYDYPLNNTIRCSNHLSKSMHLSLSIVSDENLDYLCENICEIINTAQIYHLAIREDVDVGVFNRILTPISTLDSLQIASLSLSQPGSLSSDEESVLRTVSSTNRITKVNLKTMDNIEEIYFLIELCPHLIYLRVDDINNMDMKLFVRLILMKMKTQYQSKFQLLCFHVPAADDQTIKQLNNMIDDEKLLIDYTSKRALDFFYLQWNRK